MTENYYKLLDVPKTATEEEIKKSYRRLAMKYHPDRTSGDKAKEAKFKAIKEAYETLSDKSKRAQYDNVGSQTQFSQGFGSRFNSNDVNDIFNDIFARGGFSGGMGQGPEFRQAPSVTRITANLTFWEAVFGVKKNYSTTLKHQSGKKTVEDLNVNIPSGVSSGDAFQISSPSGHKFILEIDAPNISSDGLYTRDGLDLHTKIDIPVTTAALGGKFVFSHWDGDLEIKIPAGTQSGHKLRLKSKGIKSEPNFGNIFIQINVQTPSPMTGEQKKIIQDLDKTIEKKNWFDSISNAWKKLKG